ncbi:FAD-dependent oxidoreductase [Paracraurococcus lichenis]|uniref:NAD(P)/FAD-dependent oxidoreductase n=1 Tax=Paracraurococcus lichenis TaxID=3064888 RepID=A0ABT9DT21_9PROT|nr:NAD(P)/FAD-dependent oxidoreductase [Paracraurococcus sp. LOR1-02]MDO9707041.1 NAD(P)/FAD-dependent oxidoreductase [Paracraurococcus sp. LOR1-02]
MDAIDHLAVHERRVARDLALLGFPPTAWTAAVTGPEGVPALDVLVVGAGMYGVAAAAALLQKGLRNIQVVDAAPAGLEGPWVTYARMETLRSPKHLPGIPLGIPSLTFRAWYEARHGEAGWERLYKIPNADWQDYILWVRRMLGIPVRNGVAVRRLVPSEGLVRAELATPAGEEVLHARRVVLATGRAGTGGPFVPPGIARDLWPDRAAHTMEAIDFARLRGRRVAVLGAGASAWDNAATALEQGAASVEIFARRPHLPQVNKGRGSAHMGFFEGWAELPAEEKWRLLVYMHDLQSPPPHETVLRTIRHAGFRIRFSTPILAAVRDGAGVRLTLPGGGSTTADFLIVGTGFVVDAARIPELGDLAAAVATWANRHDPPPALRRPGLARAPWLGPGFELEAREPATCPGLSRIHLFSHAAMASLGAIASDIPGASVGAERLAQRIAARFFREDIVAMRERLEAFAEPELESTPFFVPASLRGAWQTGAK